MANAIRSTPAIHWNSEQNILTKFMFTPNDILDESSKFQNRMFISFPQFVIVHAMKYIFLNYLA